MDNELQEAAVGAIGHVFETMFFVFLEPYTPDSGDPHPGPWSPNEQWLKAASASRASCGGICGFFCPFHWPGTWPPIFWGWRKRLRSTR